MPRIDLSDSLIHWTKGEDYQSAFDVLLAIIYENRLLAGCGDIKGQYYCVCFTETPKDVFHLVKGKYNRLVFVSLKITCIHLAADQ